MDFYMTVDVIFITGATQADGLPDELREVFHPFWGNYPPQHPLIMDTIGCAYILLYIVSFSGNCTVIWVFAGTKSLRKNPSNMFILNLAVSDLMMMTGQCLPVFFNTFISSYWAYGPMWCRLYAFHGATLGMYNTLINFADSLLYIT